MKERISHPKSQLALAPIQFLTLLLTRLLKSLSTPFKRHIKTTIEIHGTPSDIYSHISNFDHYPQWSPFIKSISGTLEKNETLNVFIQAKGEKGMTFRPKVLKVEADKEIRWLGSLGFKGVFDGEHYFILEKISDSKTKLIHGENFKGALVPLLWALIKTSTTKGFIDHNTALKSKVEASGKLTDNIRLQY